MYITELAWLLGCIAPPIYFLFTAIVNKNRSIIFERKMIEESENELIEFKTYLHNLEFGKELEEDVSQFSKINEL